MIYANGDRMMFLHRPISAFLGAVTFIILFWPVGAWFRSPLSIEARGRRK